MAGAWQFKILIPLQSNHIILRSPVFKELITVTSDSQVRSQVRSEVIKITGLPHKKDNIRGYHGMPLGNTSD